MIVSIFLFRVSEGMARVGEKLSSNLCVQLRLLFHRGSLHGLLLLTMLSAFRHTLGVQKEWCFPLGEPHVSVARYFPVSLKSASSDLRSPLSVAPG